MTLRAAELEVLFTAKTDGVDKAVKDVQSAGEKIEKKPITAKVTADPKAALAAMDRVEGAAKALVSKETALRLDVKIEQTEKSFARVQARLEDLKVQALGGLDVSADTRRAEAQLQKVERNLDALKKAKNEIVIEGDVEGALQALEEVDKAQGNLVSKETAIRVNADVVKAQSSVAAMAAQLAYLRALSPKINVTADIGAAQRNLDRARTELKQLEGARAEMVVDVNEGGAKEKLSSVADFAGDAGDDAGDKFGKGIIAALVTIPIAGAVVALGATAATALIDSFNDGLAQEAGRDRLQGLTGISEADALRLGRAAGEAYANTFGTSIEANMDTARLALQFDLIDEKATTRDAQKVVEGLAGIADVLGEDVRPVAAAVATLLSSGVAKSADEAFDLLATGAREGVNRNEDLLDTLTEYPALFSRLGLSGEEALGLINQGLEGGARNSDIAADALKEFQIRATDGSKLSAEGFEALGLSAEGMTKKIAAGGESARDGLAEVLTKLREIEDPVKRNAAAVALFGTQAEDMGEALFNMDLSTAVEQLNGVEGAARKMFDTLASNDATKLEQAQRNIEVAADGIKGALAAAFSEPLGEFADWVSQNRGPLMQFLLDMANGALDMGVAMVEGVASGTEAFGEFVAGPAASAVEALITLQKFLNPFADTGQLEGLVEDMKGFDDTTNLAADSMRENLVGGIEDARSKLNEFGEGAVAVGYLNDASLRLAEALGEVGVAADGSKLSLEGVDLAHLGASESGRVLEDQVRGAIAALSDEVSAAAAAGEGQAGLTQRYNTAREALSQQLQTMGLTQTQAQSLIDTVLKTPKDAKTAYSSNADSEKGKAQALADRITTLPNGKVVINGNQASEEGKVQSLGTRIRTLPNGKVYVSTSGIGAAEAALNYLARPRQTYIQAITTGSGVGSARVNAEGNLLEFMAGGGLRNLTPMPSLATMVSPNTWRVVGDRGDVPELFAPLDGSARSWQLLLEGLRRMPGAPGGFGGSAPARSLTVNLGGMHYPVSSDPVSDAQEVADLIVAAASLGD